ncbi:MAG: TonB-dependent siderophore receptor [Rhodocyclaceae bacterium]
MPTTMHYAGAAAPAPLFKPRLRPSSRLLLAAIAMGALTRADAAEPPSAAAGDKANLPHITVTAPADKTVPKTSSAATKTDTPLLETPQSISVVTREQIEAQAATTIGQALRYTPGVMAEWRGMSSAKYDHIVVRGSAGYTVDAFWDGLKTPAMGSIGGASPDPYFLERVEVLRGPSSVLYGQSAANGLVHMVSKRPTEDPMRELRLSLGNYGYAQAGIDLSGPMNDDKTLLYRVVGIGLDADSPVDNVQEQRFGIAPSLTWRPTSATSLTFLASYQKDPELGYYDTRPAIGTAFDNPNGQVSDNFSAGEPDFNASEREYTAVGYAFEHHLNKSWTLRQNLRYVDADYDWQITGFGMLRPDLRTADRYATRMARSGAGFAVDNQVEGRFRTGPLTHTALAGLDYQEEQYDNRMYVGRVAPIDIFAPVYGSKVSMLAKPRMDIRQETSQTGLYLQDQIKLGGLTLLLGGRHDRTTNQTIDRLKGTESNVSDNATTWRAGAVYQFTNGVAPYVSYAESFQPVSGTDAGGKPFEPARGRQTEVGVKWQPNAFNALFTAAAFDLTEDNITTPDDRNPRFNVQLGEVHTRGVELEGKIALTQGLSLTAAYTWIDSEITRGARNQVGQSRPNVPEHTASVWADYAFGGALAGLELGLGVRYVGSSPANAENTFYAPSSTLADLALRYDFSRLGAAWRGLRIDVNVKNLFDESYVGSCGGKTVASGYCWSGYPRTAMATVGYRW